jgi:hypothetical protein
LRRAESVAQPLFGLAEPLERDEHGGRTERGTSCDGTFGLRSGDPSWHAGQCTGEESVAPVVAVGS